MDGKWRFWFVDTRTGVKQLEVFPIKGTFSRMLNGAGRGTHTFQLPSTRLSPDHPAYDPIVDKSLSRPWARTLVVCWDTGGAGFGVLPPVVYSGIVSTRKYIQLGNKLIINEVDIRVLLGRRWPFGVQSYWENEGLHLPGRLVCEGLSYRAIIARIMQQSLLGTSDIYSLPIVLPSAVEPGPYSQTYENQNFITAADAIADIQDSAAGPDTDFPGRWNAAGNHEWVLQTGSPAQPRLVGDRFEFDMSAPKPVLLDLSVTEDGTNVRTGVISVGAGSGTDMRVGGWGLETTATIPAMDVLESHKTEVDEPRLRSYSVASVQASGAPTEQYEFSMMLGDGVEILPMTSILRVSNNNDPWIEDGYDDLRLISFSSDMSKRITLDTQMVGA